MYGKRTREKMPKPNQLQLFIAKVKSSACCCTEVIPDFWLLSIFLLVCFGAQVLYSYSSNQSCDLNDLKALEDFQKGLESGIDGWFDSDCCRWSGVICESSYKRVVGLELGSRRLRGNLSESLSGMNQLRYLNLSHNFLDGIIPMKMFRLQRLEVLDLSDNNFAGSIMTDFDLPEIRVLDVSKNYLYGNIHTGICENLTRIQVLNLSMNLIYGKLEVGLGNCTSLQHLSLDSNNLSGILPNDLFKLKKLSHLYLQNNYFTGFLMGVHNISSLVQLDLSLNLFSGIIPDVFASLGKLEHFLAHSNALVGSLPISLLNSSAIQLLNLQNNSLNGSINLDWSKMVSLKILLLGSNQFRGPIPDSLSSCRELRTLNLARNYLNTQVPESFKNLQALSYLGLANTSLHNISATLRVLQQCRNLTILFLTMNFRGEEMLEDANLQFKSLKVLIIPNCGLTGLIPQWLRSCSKLQLVDLSWNHLNGTIPDLFNGLNFLFYLDLSNNSFTGEIPKSLTRLHSLIHGIVSVDEVATGIPFFIKRNQSSRGLQYNQFWSFPPSLDLSYNMLTGKIWPEFGNLKKLHLLELSSNHLQGRIPHELSGMKSLEVLNFAHNNLSGSIPSSMTNLSFLSFFSVANNNLVGEVPLGGQFMTFPCSSFEGNLGLLIRTCNSPPPISNSEPQKIPLVFSGGDTNESEVKIIGLPFALGMTTSFFLTVAICFMSGMLFPKVKRRRKQLITDISI